MYGYTIYLYIYHSTKCREITSYMDGMGLKLPQYLYDKPHWDGLPKKKRTTPGISKSPRWGNHVFEKISKELCQEPPMEKHPHRGGECRLTLEKKTSSILNSCGMGMVYDFEFSVRPVDSSLSKMTANQEVDPNYLNNKINSKLINTKNRNSSTSQKNNT